MLVWRRYILTKFWTNFLALAVIAFSLYASVHYSLHTIKGSSTPNISLKLSILYYLSQIVLKSDFLVPQLIAVATTLTLFAMQSKREVLLLQAAGLPLKRLLAPLLKSAFVITCLLYANFQWLYPICENITSIKEHMDHGTLDKAKDRVPSLFLKDQTVLLYSSIQHKTLTLNKVFWIKDTNTIYAIEKLAFTTPSLPIGLEVTCFSKAGDGETMEVSEFFDIKEFPEIEFSFYDNPFSKIFSSQGRTRLIESFQAIPWKITGFGFTKTIPQRILALLSSFYYTIIAPLPCISAMILSAYFCLRFNRIYKASFAYCIPLGTVNIFFIFLKAGVVLADNSVFPVFPIMVAPLILLTGITQYAYLRLR